MQESRSACSLATMGSVQLHVGWRMSKQISRGGGLTVQTTSAYRHVDNSTNSASRSNKVHMHPAAVRALLLLLSSRCLAVSSQAGLAHRQLARVEAFKGAELHAV